MRADAREGTTVRNLPREGNYRRIRGVRTLQKRCRRVTASLLEAGSGDARVQLSSSSPRRGPSCRIKRTPFYQPGILTPGIDICSLSRLHKPVSCFDQRPRSATRLSQDFERCRRDDTYGAFDKYSGIFASSQSVEQLRGILIKGSG